MRWDQSRKYWHELTRVGTDGLAVFGWLHWCGADVSGLVVASPDSIGRELAMSRRRAVEALRRLSKTDHPTSPALGDLDPVVVYDFDVLLGYVVGWNSLDNSTTVRNPDTWRRRVKFAEQQPKCLPVTVCLAELAQHADRWAPKYPEAPLVDLYREAFEPTGAAMPTTRNLADHSDLRKALADAWHAVRVSLDRPMNSDEWARYFREVAVATDDDGCCVVNGVRTPVTLQWLVQSTTMAAWRKTAHDNRIATLGPGRPS